jgi:hypothetical protein
MYLYYILFVLMNICGIDCQKRERRFAKGILTFVARFGT